MNNYDFMQNEYREMPDHFVFVRHGESESNVVQEAERRGEIHEKYEEIASRPDWEQRLTADGIKQSQLAAYWLNKEFGSIDNFDGCFVSPFLRARETAALLGGSNWIVDDRIVERFRGVYGVVSYQQNYEDEDKTLRLKGIFDASPWYARLDGAESLQDVFGRYRAFQDSIKRHYARRKVLVVSHGDFIKTARYAIEWMMPEKWHRDRAKFALPNCAIIHYSRINPLDPTDRADGLSWMRIIYPDDPNNSPKGGQWQKLKIKRIFTAEELVDGVTDFPPILR